MSLDLVAVQRDAALLDALSQRVQFDDLDSAADPVLGLLAALVADVDEVVLDVAIPDVEPRAPRIPQQGRHRAPAGIVTTLPLPLAPVGRRHVARAVAAMAVAAAVLSVGGVAAAVSGDPLTPYRNVINVVRGGYHEVIPTRSGLPQPKAVVPKAKAPAKATAANAGAVAERAHNANSRPASRGASRVAEQGHRWIRQQRNRQEWNRHQSNRHVQDPGSWNGHNRDSGTWGQRNQDHRQWSGPGGYTDHVDGSTNPSGTDNRSDAGTQNAGTQNAGNGDGGTGDSGTADGDASNTGDGSGGSDPSADGSADVHQ
jgi:hypothetical protein